MTIRAMLGAALALLLAAVVASQGAVVASQGALVTWQGAAAHEALPGDPAAGRALAEEACRFCHDVAPGSHEETAAGGPPFQTIADDPTVTEAALRDFFGAPHEDMPGFMPTTAQANDVIAYILSLKE